MNEKLTINDLIIVNLASSLNIIGGLFIIINTILIIKKNGISVHKHHLIMISIINLFISIGTIIMTNMYSSKGIFNFFIKRFLLILTKRPVIM
jgi:hypothetical protein